MTVFASPISLLPICGELFEKLLLNILYEYFTTNNLITNNQSGFRSGDSTANQLIELVNEIHKSLDNCHEVRAVPSVENGIQSQAQQASC